MTDILRSNIMQRLYDALPLTEKPHEMLTVENIATIIPFGANTIAEGLKRLRRLRCTRSAFLDGQWRYARSNSAKRPADSRGRRKR